MRSISRKSIRKADSHMAVRIIYTVYLPIIVVIVPR